MKIMTILISWIKDFDVSLEALWFYHQNIMIVIKNIGMTVLPNVWMFLE